MLSISLPGMTSIAQWTLFLGIGLIIFGWIEKKESYVLGGQIIFALLGFLAFYVLLMYDLNTSKIEDVLISKEVKLFAFFRALVFFFILTIISLSLKLFKFRFQKFIVYGLVFFSLMLFFMAYNVLQMPQ